jgi:hypothetical protein
MSLKDLTVSGDEAELMRDVRRLRRALVRIREILYPIDNDRNVMTVGRAREIAAAALDAERS